MNKKKVIAMVTSLALVAVVGVGATLAYFTDKTDVKTNIVTMGKVDIELTETGSGTETTDGLHFDNVMPGDILSKEPVVTVASDSQDAYVRLKMTIEASDGFRDLEGVTNVQDEIASYLNINDQNWVKIEQPSQTDPSKTDIYYYYQNVAKANDKLTFFTTVTLPQEKLNNKIAGGSFTIHIQAEAIQAANIAENLIYTGTQITGWPQAEIEKFQ